MDNAVQILQSVMDAFPKSNFVARWARRSVRRIRKYISAKREPISTSMLVCRDYGIPYEIVKSWESYLSEETPLPESAIEPVLIMAARNANVACTPYGYHVRRIVELLRAIQDEDKLWNHQ